MAGAVSFAIAVENLQWVRGTQDDPHDLCAHGEVTVVVGGETLRDGWCVSASALRMLRTLSEDHALRIP